MNFQDYLNQAWNTHAQDPKGLASSFKDQFSLISSESDALAMGNLIVHVCGEHLGDWDKGLSLISELKFNTHVKDQSGLNRFNAILELGKNPAHSIVAFPSSDQIRIFSITASALVSLGDLSRASDYLDNAQKLASDGLSKDDPANRSLAITGNNLASALEEKKQRSKEETELMLMAAHMGRKYWEIAGGWMEVERAEYRLASSYLHAGNPEIALTHINKCLEIIEANGNDPIEVLFGNEMLAMICNFQKNHSGYMEALTGMEIAFGRLSADDQSWCQDTLSKIKKLGE